MAPSKTAPIVDVHTHIYPPSYLKLLSSRTTPPQLLHINSPTDDPTPSPRLVILPSDAPSANPSVPHSKLGRPIGPEYSSVSEILSFMNMHSIDISVLSLANPWLDFLPSSEAAGWARDINNELNSMCAESQERIYAFGCLPLSAPVSAIVTEIERLVSPACRYIRGIILGTSGLGSGLDDSAMNPIWEAIQAQDLLVFIHPHYGLPSEVFGARMPESGHVLPLSLGFPLETTIAFTRMYLVGIFDRFASLRILLAHAGGAIPALVGRVQSCVEHERGYYSESRRRTRGPQRSMAEVMRKNVYLDAVSYNKTGVKAAVDMVGKERVLFGTDHPFFPPLGEEQDEWMSVRTNIEAVHAAFETDAEGIQGVLGGNAVRLLGLDTYRKLSQR
ncbi:MAG: hypothetical protein LQ343_004797 [Gyalolechia ehrenbergii]|nr:MAG: hypothetical protein LQ343_004797 [Gyalolechia ehrenbergii]